MRPYLQHLLEYFNEHHIGNNWETEQDGNIRWTIRHLPAGNIWIEVTHHVRDEINVYVHIATNNPQMINGIVTLFAPTDQIENIPVELPHYEVKQGWYRLGCYINDHLETPERFALISRIVLRLAGTYN
jgi:hypothetical protein